MARQQSLTIPKPRLSCVAAMRRTSCTAPGDQSDISVAFHDDYSTAEDRWRNAAGDPITAEEGAEASVILPAQEYYSIMGIDETARPA